MPWRTKTIKDSSLVAERWKASRENCLRDSKHAKPEDVKVNVKSIRWAQKGGILDDFLRSFSKHLENESSSFLPGTNIYPWREGMRKQRRSEMIHILLTKMHRSVTTYKVYTKAGLLSPGKQHRNRVSTSWYFSIPIHLALMPLGFGIL